MDIVFFRSTTRKSLWARLFCVVWWQRGTLTAICASFMSLQSTFARILMHAWARTHSFKHAPRTQLHTHAPFITDRVWWPRGRLTAIHLHTLSLIHPLRWSARAYACNPAYFQCTSCTLNWQSLTQDPDSGWPCGGRGQRGAGSAAWWHERLLWQHTVLCFPSHTRAHARTHARIHAHARTLTVTPAQTHVHAYLLRCCFIISLIILPLI